MGLFRGLQEFVVVYVLSPLDFNTSLLCLLDLFYIRFLVFVCFYP